jgi:hypothetical protein
LHYKSLAIIISALSLLFVSCNLFKTRDPENPVNNSSTLPTATDAEILMENFSQALSQNNVTEYKNLFTDQAIDDRRFSFIPSQSAAVRYASVFAAWDRESEYNYFNKAVSEIGTSSLQVSMIPSSIVKYADSALWIVDYTLFVPHKRSSVTTQFIGKSEFHMASNKNGIWRIYQWTDYETKRDSSWSELKGQFSQ